MMISVHISCNTTDKVWLYSTNNKSYLNDHSSLSHFTKVHTVSFAVGFHFFYLYLQLHWMHIVHNLYFIAMHYSFSSYPINLLRRPSPSHVSFILFYLAYILHIVSYKHSLSIMENKKEFFFTFLFYFIAKIVSKA
jgi:hypothetical protein